MKFGWRSSRSYVKYVPHSWQVIVNVVEPCWMIVVAIDSGSTSRA